MRRNNALNNFTLYTNTWLRQQKDDFKEISQFYTKQDKMAVQGIIASGTLNCILLDFM